MRSWFQFGYDGFPSGELRRRFFRQRDDPCGSEEDNDYDDETNDRPVYYYPLRPSEEGSSARASSGGAPSEEDEDMMGVATAPVSAPLHAHTTAYESIPALFGATAVPFTGQRCRRRGALEGREEEMEERYLLWHGGASVAAPWVSDAFTLARLGPCGGAGRHCDGGVRYTPVATEPSLEDLLHTPLSHPALRACRVENERLYGDWDFAPPRFGHCAAPVVLPGGLARRLLTEGLPQPTRDEMGRIVCPPVEPFLDAAVSNKDDYELHLSLVIGGTERVPTAPQEVDARVPTAHPASPSSAPLRGSTTRSSFPNATTTLTPLSSSAEVRVRSHIRSVTMSRPAVSFTLLRKPGGDGVAAPAHWTRSFELWGSSRLPLEPRMFATLTPWPRREEEEEGGGSARHTLSFAYLGGTETGLTPAPLFPLIVIELNYRAWQWSSRVVQTFGTEPSPRFGHSTSYCDGSFLVFGGVGRGGGCLNDLFVLNGRTKVWREVFVPMNVGLPPRAFHCAPLLHPPRGQPGGREWRGRTTGGGPLSATHREGEDAGEEGRECLTERPTGAQILFVGGENDGGVEPSLWICALDTATWQPCHLPLLSRVESYHVGPPSTAVEPERGGSAQVNNGLSAFKLQEVVHALMERYRAGSAPPLAERRAPMGSPPSSAGTSSQPCGATGPPLSPRSPPHLAAAGDAFVPAVHGSLAQAVALPTRLGGGLLLLGGSRSPPVLLATHLQAPAGTLKELTAFWLLASPHSLPTQLMRRTPAYFWQMLRSTQFRSYVAGLVLEPVACRTGTAGRVPSVKRVMSEAASAAAKKEEEERRDEAASAAMQETNRLVSQGALDEQLSVWMRSARRRSREERLS